MQFTLQTQPNFQKYVPLPQTIPRQMQMQQNAHLNIINTKPSHQNIIQHNQKQLNQISYSNPCEHTIRTLKENIEISNNNNNNNKNNIDSQQFNRLEQRIDKLVEENRQVNQQLMENGSQMKQFEILNSKMEMELNRLRGQDQEFKLIKEMNELRQKECENSQQKIIELQSKLNAANTSLSEMEKKLSIYENQECEWRKKQNDIEQLKLSNLDEIRSQLQKNNNEIIESIKQQYEENKQKYEEKIQVLENNLDVLSVEFEQSQNTIQELNEQVRQWKIKYSKIQVNQKQSLSRISETEQEHIQMLIEEIESLNQQLNDRNIELEQQKLLIESATEYVPQLRDENSQLKEQLDSISEELENLKQQFN